MKFGKHIDELKIGDSASFSKTMSESDVYLFAGITGDFNPAHVDEEYARDTFFEGRIVHGILTAGFISTVIAGQLPGPGTIYVSQQLKFLAPVRMGDTLTARAEVAKIISEKNRVILKTTCSIQDGTIVLDGEAVVSPPKQKN